MVFIGNDSTGLEPLAPDVGASGLAVAQASVAAAYDPSASGLTAATGQKSGPQRAAPKILRDTRSAGQQRTIGLLDVAGVSVQTRLPSKRRRGVIAWIGRFVWREVTGLAWFIAIAAMSMVVFIVMAAVTIVSAVAALVSGVMLLATVIACGVWLHDPTPAHWAALSHSAGTFALFFAVVVVAGYGWMLLVDRDDIARTRHRF